VDKVFTRIMRKRGSVVRMAFPDSRDRLPNALIRVLRVAQHFPHGSPVSTDGLRRHVVLHGLDPTFGTEKASLQGILMLEALHYHLQP
jgi:hypothetical protein